MLGMGNASLIGSWYITYACIFAVLCTVFVATASLQVRFHIIRNARI